VDTIIIGMICSRGSASTSEEVILIIQFANEEPCEVCGGNPTRLRYGNNKEDNVFLCEEHYGEGEE